MNDIFGDFTSASEPAVATESLPTEPPTQFNPAKKSNADILSLYGSAPSNNQFGAMSNQFTMNTLGQQQQQQQSSQQLFSTMAGIGQMSQQQPQNNFMSMQQQPQQHNQAAFMAANPFMNNNMFQQAAPQQQQQQQFGHMNQLNIGTQQATQNTGWHQQMGQVCGS